MRQIKVEHLNLLKSRTFKFDMSYFWYPLNYRVIQYLIWKDLDMVKMSQEESVVAAPLAYVRTSWKLTIYYINGVLLILFCKPLYLLCWCWENRKYFQDYAKLCKGSSFKSCSSHKVLFGLLPSLFSFFNDQSQRGTQRTFLLTLKFYFSWQQSMT